MSTKLERTSKKDVKYANSMDKWTRYTISLGIGCFLGLFTFLLANPFYTFSYSGAEVKNVVADCKRLSWNLYHWELTLKAQSRLYQL